MADVQKQFEEFHGEIRIDYDTLRSKRDIIMEVIKKYLKENKLPGFDELHQGSYAMGLGIAPIGKLEYDLDLGLRFEINDRDFTAAEVGKWVFEAVKNHTDNVKHKGPCVRVTYAAGAGNGYHVDLVSYAWQKDAAGQETFKLAHKDKGWLPANPPALLTYVERMRKPFEKTLDTKTQTDQFRRSVRYLKRWNDVAMPEESDGKPTGLALVLLCAERLSPAFNVAGKPDDLAALRALASFTCSTPGRLVAQKPTPEYEDVLAKLSAADMQALKARFETLAKALDQASQNTDPVEACKLLATVFGDDFPVPAAVETARRTGAPAIITSSSSA